MRTRFDLQLTDLNNHLMEMAGMIENAIAMTIQAITHNDAALASKIVDGDNVIDEKEKGIERECLKLIMQQHPVASDLRVISAALKMITDMERIGDQAADISELIVYLAGFSHPEMMDRITQMADLTRKMVTESINAYVRKDLNLAHDVIARDDAVDQLFTETKEALIALIHEDADSGSAAIDMLMIAKYFERIGDHAVNIAEWVEFSITGVHKNHQIM